MKISPSVPKRASVLAALIYICVSASAFAQGSDNPTGVSGVFNGNSTTGCSYDPYTANAQRTIPDLTVAGAVGKYPLQWSRIMNSRGAPAGLFGQGGGWRHSYQWSCSATQNITQAPDSYTLYYPDGRQVTFDANVNTPWLPPVGVTDRFAGIIGTGYVYLYLTDGGKVRFYQTMTGPVEGYYSFSISLPDQIIDPFGQVTALTYTTGKLSEVDEPGGRKLKIYYGTTGASTGFVRNVDALASDGHVSQWVNYSYAAQIFGGQSYNVLTRADYIGTPAPFATYAYQASNKSPTGNPLIKTCQDVRSPGPMKNIQYVFVTSSPLSYGQLYQEKNINGTLVAQLTVSGSTRTEMRGDGTNAVRGPGNPTRTFTYGAIPAGGTIKNYLLKTYSDFQGHTTTLSYNADAFISSIKDPKTHVTNLEYLNQGFPTGVVTKVSHPSDGSSIQYFYTDATGAYLDYKIDERVHYTYYKRNTGTMTTYEIDYPDGGIEKYTYNTFGEVLTHTMPSNTATDGASTDSEKYSYNSTTGQLLTYTPPATASDPTPSPHPTRYHYDANDHVDTITDPKGNVTTLYHNEIGQLTIQQHADNSQIGYAYNTDGTLQYKNVQLNAATFAETDYVYDDYKRVVSVTNPVGEQTAFYYDVAGATTTGLGHTDANVTRLVLPSTKVTQTLYDENLRKGQVIVGLGTVDAATTTYTYDEVGNLKTMKDPNGQTSGATWTYNYDARDRLLNVIDPLTADRNSLGHTIDYTYDLAGNKTSERRANDQMINYDNYDEMNRLTQKTVGQWPNSSAVTKYTWTNAGKMASMTDPGSTAYPNGNLYQYDYDRLNRLSTTTYPSPGGTETRTYDFAGNLATFKNRTGSISNLHLRYSQSRAKL